MLVVRFSGRLSDGDVDGMCSAFERAAEQHQQFGVVITTADVTLPPLHLLQRIADWLAKHRETMSRRCVATGLHVDSTVIRGAIKFTNAITPTPNPQAAFATYDETVAWVEGRLAEAGVQPN